MRALLVALVTATLSACTARVAPSSALECPPRTDDCSAPNACVPSRCECTNGAWVCSADCDGCRRPPGPPRPPRPAGGDGVVERVVSEHMKALGSCVEQALRLNPGLAVGSVTLRLSVAPSGDVAEVQFEPPKWRDAEWARCMASVVRRARFPASDQDLELQIPLKVGVNPL